MARIESFDALRALVRDSAHLLSLRHHAGEINAAQAAAAAKASGTRKDLMVCGGTGCQASDSKLLVDNLNAVLREKGLERDVHVVTTGCLGFCVKVPIV